MAPSRKKVLVRLLTGTVIPGYLPTSGICTRQEATPVLDLLDLSGRLHPVPLAEVRLVAYVREFNLSEPDPEQLARRAFLSRPRNEGLWLRLTFAPGDVLEGLAAADLSVAESLIADGGLFISPPDPHSNSHQLFVPRSALVQLEFVAVVSTVSRPKPAKVQLSDRQSTLFPPS